MFDIVVRNKAEEVIQEVNCPDIECGIGKAAGNLIRLRGWKVAAQHAELFFKDKSIYIRDLSNGNTLVNSEAFKDEKGPLRASDTITIGGFRIFVGVDGDQSNPGIQLVTQVGVQPHAAIKEDSSEIEDQRFKWRNKIHDELLHNMDLRRTDIGSMNEDQLRKHIKNMIKEIIKDLGDELPKKINKTKLLSDVLNEAIGLGPLEELIADESITEIMVNRYDEIYIEKKGKLTRSEIVYSSDDAVMSAIERIVAPLGRRIDESSPMVDARLQDGSRVNAIIPPLALRGPCITIRKFSKQKLFAKDLIKFDAINQAMIDFLEMAVLHKKNIVVSGGTGSGKTTLLNILSNFIPSSERIVTVEDAAELQLAQPHLVRLEARPPNTEGKGAISIRELVKNCLRMRPDRIVVGECRGGEALDMLQAMNTGHDGSLTTAHANTPRDMMARLEVMVMMSGMELPSRAIREQISSAVDIVVQQTRFSDGSRRVVNITEITGMETDTIQMQDIFTFKQRGFNKEGNVTGDYITTGRVPEFYEELSARGIKVDMSIFQNSK